MAYPELIWPWSVYKVNSSCKGVGKEPFLPGALPLQTEVMFWGKKTQRMGAGPAATLLSQSLGNSCVFVVKVGEH